MTGKATKTLFKFRYTLVVEYTGRIEDYEGAETPEQMAAMDLASIQEGALSPYDFADIEGSAPKVEQIEVLR